MVIIRNVGRKPKVKAKERGITIRKPSSTMETTVIQEGKNNLNTVKGKGIGSWIKNLFK